jgi:hypothetical protein
MVGTLWEQFAMNAQSSSGKSIRWSLSYAEAEHTLAFLHGVKGDVRQNAFRARLKHLKRLGIPRGITPGSGAKIYYFEEQLFEWAFCLELAEFGIDPTVIVDLISRKWDDDILPHMATARAEAHGDLFFVAEPSVMSAALAGTKDTLPYQWLKADKILRRIRAYGRRRSLVFNISDLCRLIGQAGIDFHSKRAAREA